MIARLSVVLVLFTVITAAACGSNSSSGATPATTNNSASAAATDTTPIAANTPAATNTPTNTPTPAPTATPTRGPIGLSRTSPAPIGSAIQLGDWTIVVNSVVPNANQIVRGANQFNDPPKAGTQFYIVNVSATYTGSKEPSQFLAGVTLKLVGKSSVSYDSSSRCGVIPGALDNFKDVFKGGTLTGNLCWAVGTDDVASVEMFGSPFLGNDTRWWSVQPQ